MWNTALIFSNKIHDLQKKKLEKKFFYCRLCKNYWITYCTHMMSHEIWVDETADVTQQKFVLMKTPWRRLSSSSSEDVFMKMNILTLLIRLQKTPSRRLQDVLQKRHQDILKTPSRRFQNDFKTSSRRLQDVLQRCLQDLFKMYHWVNLFLLTRFQDVFETLSKRF